MAVKKFEVIFVIVNTGFSEVVMDAARKKGAKGGTILHARGTGNKIMEQKFNVVVTPEKEIVMILCTQKHRDELLEEINKAAGLGTPGSGIAFTLPVERVAGIQNIEEKIK